MLDATEPSLRLDTVSNTAFSRSEAALDIDELQYFQSFESFL